MTLSTQIHPTAIIESGAELDSGVVVGPYAIVGKHVKIGKNTKVHSHALITGHTTIGDDNEIYSFAAVGNPPQDLKYKGEETTLVIGHKNTIREYATLQIGTIQGAGTTIVGDGNLLMAYTHVAHDCIVGNQNVIANGTQLAGHVTVCNQTVLGGLTAVHQFVVLGDMCMTGGGAMVVGDVPPYCIAEGNRATLRGLNMVAMQRRGLSPETRQGIKEVYKKFFLNQYATIDDAISQLPESYFKLPEVCNFIEFIKNSKRGVVRPASSTPRRDPSHA